LKRNYANVRNKDAEENESGEPLEELHELDEEVFKSLKL
jgi:hypothetical protein